MKKAEKFKIPEPVGREIEIFNFYAESRGYSRDGLCDVLETIQKGFDKGIGETNLKELGFISYHFEVFYINPAKLLGHLGEGAVLLVFEGEARNQFLKEILDRLGKTYERERQVVLKKYEVGRLMGTNFNLFGTSDVVVSEVNIRQLPQ
tara:strand:- start:94 stop:540 length:447 start_codon:yes stop_codon:yes gene_type:complete